eukprot:1148295-Pelagomonas_calceolata.AAC.6
MKVPSFVSEAGGNLDHARDPLNVEHCCVHSNTQACVKGAAHGGSRPYALPQAYIQQGHMECRFSLALTPPGLHSAVQLDLHSLKCAAV